MKCTQLYNFMLSYVLLNPSSTASTSYLRHLVLLDIFQPFNFNFNYFSKPLDEDNVKVRDIFKL